MLEFLRLSLTPDIFWTALGSMAITVALIMIALELPRFRKEIASHKVEGLKFALTHIQEDEFKSWHKIIRDEWIKGGDEYPMQIDSSIVHIFSRLDFIAKLIDIGFVDQELLFYMTGNDLYDLGSAIVNFEHRKNSQIPNSRAAYPGAYKLLKEAKKVSTKESFEAFERLSTYKNDKGLRRATKLLKKRNR